MCSDLGVIRDVPRHWGGAQTLGMCLGTRRVPRQRGCAQVLGVCPGIAGLPRHQGGAQVPDPLQRRAVVEEGEPWCLEALENPEGAWAGVRGARCPKAGSRQVFSVCCAHAVRPHHHSWLERLGHSSGLCWGDLGQCWQVLG